MTESTRRSYAWLFLSMPALVALLLFAPPSSSSGVRLSDVVSGGERPNPAPSAQTPASHRTQVLSRLASVGVANTPVFADAAAVGLPFPGFFSQQAALSETFLRAAAHVNQSALGRAPPASFFRS